MLQRQTYQEQDSNEDTSQFLDVFYIFDVLKRRAFYFVIPFLLILVIGTFITVAWPARYLAEGKILVSSQEIPSDLVRPTVGALANERMQIIEQRIMTRDNLLPLAQKFHLTQSWQGMLLGTEIIDFIRERTHIRPLELNLQSQVRKDAIAFTVGFEYEKPQIAMGVANEIVTMILNQDVRTRTNFASETTKFLERDVNRIEDQLRSLDATISQRTRLSGGGTTNTDTNARELAELRSQLLVMGTIYSQSHPTFRALKRKIEILEKSTAATNASNSQSSASTNKNVNPSEQATSTANPNEPGLDALETKKKSLKEELQTATLKVAAARLGESLERGQHSERLEVIEQPTLPQKPISPNRPKIFAFVAVFALMAGGALLAGAEALNPAIRRKADILPLIDSRLLVSIPHIYTHGEVRRRRNKIILGATSFALVVVAALAVIIFVLPPLDVLLQKAAAALIR
jgi:uncharacterized protein involved in exopolysaccharide biosynthesis